MTSALPLRPYQEQLATAVENAWEGRERPTGTGVANPVAFEAATGAGKTRIAVEIIMRRLARHPRGRALWLTHREELADQAARAFHSVAPDLSVGIVRGPANDYHRQVVIGSVPTLGARGGRRCEPIRDVVVMGADEAHHSVMGGTWETVLGHFGAWQGTPTFGVSATLLRGDGKHLGDVWREVVGRWSILDGIRGGYLTDVRGKRIRIRGLDLGRVKRSGGDLQADALAGELHDAKAAEQVLDGYELDGAGQAAMAFWPNVATAVEFAEAAQARGIEADVVLGTTPTLERAAIYERSRHLATEGIPHILSNCMVLTEGFDAPWISCILMCRMTESRGLYIQCVGRGVRTWTNPVTHVKKTDCRLLDFTGVGARHRLAGISDLTMAAPEDDEKFESELDDELSLLEAEEERQGRADAPEPEGIIPGHVVSKEFDPFADSSAMWLQTWAGVPFITARGRPDGTGRYTPSYVLYLRPMAQMPGLFDIVSQPVGGAAHQAMVRESGMSYEYGMRHAERLALLADPQLAGKGAPWRDARQPTAAQIGMAQRLGLWVAPDATRGQLSDLISIATATRTIHS